MSVAGGSRNGSTISRAEIDQLVKKRVTQLTSAAAEVWRAQGVAEEGLSFGEILKDVFVAVIEFAPALLLTQTIPSLSSNLFLLQTDVGTIQDTTVPSLQTSLTDVQATIGTDADTTDFTLKGAIKVVIDDQVQLESDLADAEAELTVHTDALVTLGDRVTVLEGIDVDGRVQVLEDQLLDSRLSTLESQTLDTRLDVIEGQTLDTRVGVIEGQTLNTRVGVLESQTLNTRVATLESYTLNTRVGVLEGQNLNSRLAAVESSLATHLAAATQSALARNLVDTTVGTVGTYYRSLLQDDSLTFATGAANRVVGYTFTNNLQTAGFTQDFVGNNRIGLVCALTAMTSGVKVDFTTPSPHILSSAGANGSMLRQYLYYDQGDTTTAYSSANCFEVQLIGTFQVSLSYDAVSSGVHMRSYINAGSAVQTPASIQAGGLFGQSYLIDSRNTDAMAVAFSSAWVPLGTFQNVGAILTNLASTSQLVRIKSGCLQVSFQIRRKS